jgi:hypothetical protein
MAIRDKYGTAYALSGLANALEPDDPNLKKVIIRGLTMTKQLNAPHIALTCFIGAARVYYAAGQHHYAFLLYYAIKNHPLNKDGKNQHIDHFLKEFGVSADNLSESILTPRTFEELVEEVMRDWA